MATLIHMSFCEKDGPYKRNYYKRTTDMDKPKCWIEGFHYQFRDSLQLVCSDTTKPARTAVVKN